MCVYGCVGAIIIAFEHHGLWQHLSSGILLSMPTFEAGEWRPESGRGGDELAQGNRNPNNKWPRWSDHPMVGVHVEGNGPIHVQYNRGSGEKEASKPRKAHLGAWPLGPWACDASRADQERAATLSADGARGPHPAASGLGPGGSAVAKHQKLFASQNNVILENRSDHGTGGGGGVGTRPWWLALLACGGAYWPLPFEPSAMTSRHLYYSGHLRCHGGGGGVGFSQKVWICGSVLESCHALGGIILSGLRAKKKKKQTSHS